MDTATVASLAGPPAAVDPVSEDADTAAGIALAMHIGQRVTDITATRTYTCAVAEDGLAFCWGGLDGEGDPSPILITGDRRFRTIAAGASHMCMLDGGGAAYCRGVNAYGQLGTGDTTHIWPVPAPVAGDLRFTALTAGGLTTCGLDAKGIAYCWGSYHPPLSGSPPPLLRPTPVPGGLHFASLDAGSGGVCGITIAGALYCWGEKRGAVEPKSIAADVRFRSVSVGDGVTCAVDIEDRARCWGQNEFGQLGHGTDGGRQDQPAPISGDIRFSMVSVGSVHACGVAMDGKAYCWGSNKPAMLGTTRPTTICDVGGPSERACSPFPVLVEFAEPFETLRVGDHHACGITRSGRLVCWGHNQYGELGTGWDDEPTPLEVRLSR
jgi:alpha-tubulin suppressor-like RCC1 family protein